MPTKANLISDIILRLSRSKPSADFELEPRQVAFWLDQILGATIKAALDEKIKGAEGVDPTYICVEDSISPIKHLTNVNKTDQFYFDLCCEPMNLYRDGGVIRIATTDGSPVDKIKMSEMEDIYALKFSKPSLKNLKYNRVRSRIYIQGLTTDTIGLANFTVAYVPKIKLLDQYSDSDNIYLSEEILPVVMDAVWQIGFKQMYQTSQDVSNDGIQQDINPQDS